MAFLAQHKIILAIIVVLLAWYVYKYVMAKG